MTEPRNLSPKTRPESRFDDLLPLDRHPQQRQAWRPSPRDAPGPETRPGPHTGDGADLETR